MNPNFLDFEQPIAELDAKIAELAAQGVQTTGYAQTRFRSQVQAESRRYALLAQQVGIKDE